MLSENNPKVVSDQWVMEWSGTTKYLDALEQDKAAEAALEEGHSVTLFRARDAAPLIRDPVIDALTGLGTGRLRDHFDALVGGGAPFYVSGMSAKSRDVSDADLAGEPAELAMSNVLVRLSLDHDRMFSY
jgi:predicted peroxiredoxin